MDHIRAPRATIRNPLLPTRNPQSAIRNRAAFTLIELLVAILVIGIMSSLVLAALNRARQSANLVNTKSTIAKLHTQIQMKWDSYRIRKVPVDPQRILNTIQANSAAYPIVQNWLHAWGLYNPQPASAANNRQVAAVRLLAMRELQRYEMPNGFEDFANLSGSPGAYQPRSPDVLTSVPSLALTYLRKLNAATSKDPNQLALYSSAECLYMITTTGMEDTAFGAEQSIPKSVGDADGDGLLEFQDAWPVPETLYPVAGTQRSPIFWDRWPAGFRNSAGSGTIVSDLDPDPGWSAPLAARLQFSVAYHDYFDTLKVDLPNPSINNGCPRGFEMMPLIYSAGPDGIPFAGNVKSLDPYDPSSESPYNPPYNTTNGAAPGPPINGWQDNVHNHLIEAR